MDLRSTQLKDTYGNLVTTGTTAGSPTSGGLQNGQGTLLTSVGIGTNSPDAFIGNGNVIHLYNATTSPEIRVQRGNGSDLTIVSTSTAGGSVIRTTTGSPLILGSNNQERLRIDSSGNVLVGKDASNYASEGIELRPTELLVTKDSGTVLSLRRNTSDGTIISFAKDGSSVGTIGVTSGSFAIGQTDTGIGFFNGDRIAFPATSAGVAQDNAIDLGYSGARFDDIYATNGTIQTSDVNEKQDIEELSEAELRVAQKAKTLIRKYRWKSSVEEKGDDARIHFGIIAQDLEQAFTDEGLDAGRYGMFIKSTWTNEDGEEQTRLGVRYNQLLAFIISAI